MLKRIIVFALAALAVPILGPLAGCASSPPSHFYLLTAVTPATTQTASGKLRAPVRVAAVHLPSTLDRQEIVRTGPGNRIEIDGFHRWGAPLDEMAQRVLTQDLVARLPAGDVVLPNSPAPSGTDNLVVDLVAFQSNADGSVRLEGSWSLLAPGASTPTLIHNVRYDETTSARNFDRQAAVMSRMLARLADDIARSLPRR